MHKSNSMYSPGGALSQALNRWRTAQSDSEFQRAGKTLKHCIRRCLGALGTTATHNVLQQHGNATLDFFLYLDSQEWRSDHEVLVALFLCVSNHLQPQDVWVWAVRRHLYRPAVQSLLFSHTDTLALGPSEKFPEAFLYHLAETYRDPLTLDNVLHRLVLAQGVLGPKHKYLRQYKSLAVQRNRAGLTPIEIAVQHQRPRAVASLAVLFPGALDFLGTNQIARHPGIGELHLLHEWNLPTQPCPLTDATLAELARWLALHENLEPNYLSPWGIRPEDLESAHQNCPQPVFQWGTPPGPPRLIQLPSGRIHVSPYWVQTDSPKEIRLVRLDPMSAMCLCPPGPQSRQAKEFASEYVEHLTRRQVVIFDLYSLSPSQLLPGTNTDSIAVVWRCVQALIWECDTCFQLVHLQRHSGVVEERLITLTGVLAHLEQPTVKAAAVRKVANASRNWETAFHAFLKQSRGFQMGNVLVNAEAWQVLQAWRNLFVAHLLNSPDGYQPLPETIALLL